ncbi:unnamed protein product [Ophioblennius macclurei]
MEQEGMLIRSIYYGKIGSSATEKLLERFGHDGSFLLRDSETVRGAYCLCVRKAPYVHAYRLVHTDGQWCLQISGVTLQRFPTVEALIENCRRTQVASMPSLTDPLDKTQLPSCMAQEFFYMELNSSASVL